MLLAVLAVAIWWKVRGQYAEPKLDAREAAALDEGSGPYPSSPAGRTAAFVFGIIGLWACLDWPLASLGAGYLASAQMIRQVLMVLVVAPLLLFATPSALAVRAVGWGRRLQVLRFFARPPVALLFAASVLVLVNSPAIVDRFIATPYGSFALDISWILAGFVVWTPVQCPHPGVRRLEGVWVIGYLILQSIVPIIPGFWMTWADDPIFSTYELAPRVFEGYDPVVDQQAAAAILQVGGMVVLWLQIAFRFLHWGYQQMNEDDRGTAKPKVATPAS
jgi:putative membrane protein